MDLRRVLVVSLYFLLTSVGHFSAAFAQRDIASKLGMTCRNLFQNDYSSQNTRLKVSDWINFQYSDPRTHDSKNFRYVVHGVNDYNLESLLSKSPNIYINSKKQVSASLISNGKNRTFGNFGLIIEIDPISIIQVFNFDASSWTFDRKKVVQLKEQPLQFTPVELIKETPSNKYNEILIEPLGQKIKVVGLFVNIFSKDQWFIDDNLRSEVQKLAIKFDLPIIEINPYEE